MLICNLGPTIANITGNVPPSLLLPTGRHTCLASRVFDTFKTVTLVEDSDNPLCLDTCPYSSVCIEQHLGHKAVLISSLHDRLYLLVPAAR
jgi:hypothetical protein